MGWSGVMGWTASITQRIAAVEARLDALEAKPQTPTPEPRPQLMYVDEVPADGTYEIRWEVLGGDWGGWYRLVAAVPSSSAVGLLQLTYHDDDAFCPRKYVNLRPDRCVQVRPVMDPQTGDTLGEVA